MALNSHVNVPVWYLELFLSRFKMRDRGLKCFQGYIEEGLEEVGIADAKSHFCPLWETKYQKRQKSGEISGEMKMLFSGAHFSNMMHKLGRQGASVLLCADVEAAHAIPQAQCKDGKWFLS